MKFKHFLALFSILVSAGFGYSSLQEDSTQKSSYLSVDGLQELREWSYGNQLVAHDLLNSRNSEVIADLSMANALFSAGESDNAGLIATLKDADGGAHFLLFTPTQEKNTKELAALAAANIEGLSLEVDQEVVMFAHEEAEADNTALLDAILETEEPKKAVKALDTTINIAIIDSGIDTKHPDFLGLMGDSFDTTGETGDGVGHGTHMASIVAQNTNDFDGYNVSISDFKIVDNRGMGQISDVIPALKAAIERNIEVVNMSFGVRDDSIALKELVNEANERGMILVAAAGNSGNDEAFYPAYYGEVIAVGSLNRANRALSSSNYGFVDIAAPGFRVRAAKAGTDYYTYKSGTSPASANVAAMAARLLTSETPEGGWNTASVLKALIAGGVEITDGTLAGVYAVK